MELHLSNETFIVTAASGGLGLAAAKALVAEGANVVLVARRAEALADAVNDLGERAFALAGDLTDPAVPSAAVDLALHEFGTLSGALISVGGPPPGSVLGTDDATWTAAFGSVFLPALRVARAVVAAQPAARLGFVLSSSTKSPLPQMAPSNGLRPGLAMVVKQLADEIGPAGGRAFGLMPGTIYTERIAYLYSHSGDPATAQANAEQQIPLRRLGDPAEFGTVAAFLLSQAASYITGSMIPVDGGVLRTL